MFVYVYKIRIQYTYLFKSYGTETIFVAQLDTPSDWRPRGHGFDPHRGQQHSFVETDHEIFSTVILSLPLIQEGQLPQSQADRAGYENPGEDCGLRHQTVGVHRRFPVWLPPRQRHYRRNLCCQAAAGEISSCQQETLYGFRRPGGV